jgi:hypothetical protein
MSMFLNRSAIKNLNGPSIELAVSLKDLKGDIKINPPGFLLALR